MRFLGIEINWSPKCLSDGTVWHRAPAQPKRLGDMTPKQLRAELSMLHGHIRTQTGVVCSAVEDPFQRVHLAHQRPHQTSRGLVYGRDRVYLDKKKKGEVP